VNTTSPSAVFLTSAPGGFPNTPTALPVTAVATAASSPEQQTNQMIQTVTQQIQQLQQIIQQLHGNQQNYQLPGGALAEANQLQQLTQQLQPLLQQLQALQLQQQQQQQARFPPAGPVVVQGLPPPSVPVSVPPGVLASSAYAAPLTQPVSTVALNQPNNKNAAVHHIMLPATENFREAAKQCTLIAKNPTYSTGTRVGAALDSVIYRMRSVEEKRKHKSSK